MAYLPLACWEPSKAQPTIPVTPYFQKLQPPQQKQPSTTHQPKEKQETQKKLIILHSSHHSEKQYDLEYHIYPNSPPLATQPPHLCIGQLTELFSGNGLRWLHCCQAEDDAKSSTEAQQRSGPGEAFWGRNECWWKLEVHFCGTVRTESRKKMQGQHNNLCNLNHKSSSVSVGSRSVSMEATRKSIRTGNIFYLLVAKPMNVSRPSKCFFWNRPSNSTSFAVPVSSNNGPIQHMNSICKPPFFQTSTIT